MMQSGMNYEQMGQQITKDNAGPLNELMKDVFGGNVPNVAPFQMPQQTPFQTPNQAPAQSETPEEQRGQQTQTHERQESEEAKKNFDLGMRMKMGTMSKEDQEMIKKNYREQIDIVLNIMAWGEDKADEVLKKLIEMEFDVQGVIGFFMGENN